MLEKVNYMQELVEIKGDDKAFLATKARPAFEEIKSSGNISLVDLFCGAGGITLGILEAARSLNKKVKIELAVDIDEKALNVYIDNFPNANATLSDVLSIFESEINAPLNPIEKKLRDRIVDLDFLVGGPPCQGHSDLNNFSRRKDHKNSLYFVMARAAKIFQPNFIIIENVPGAKHDKNNVFNNTANELEMLGYKVSFETINLFDIGVPQKRKRLILVASKDKLIKIDEIVSAYKTMPKSLHWAIHDLMHLDSQDLLMDTPSRPSKDNMSRIEYLFENKLFDLPNEQRPPCHQKGNHTYKSIYGRMKWEEPSQTITSGFYSMCMGRYVHPQLPRTLTAHEAARLQFFPDYFSFRQAKTRTSLATIIGNAVPPKLSFVLVHGILNHFNKGEHE